PPLTGRPLPFASSYHLIGLLIAMDGDLPTEDFHLISSCPCWAYTKKCTRKKQSYSRASFRLVFPVILAVILLKESSLKTEHWALLISFLALAASVVIPLCFRWFDGKEKTANKREVLLQKILTLKSLASTSKYELIYLVQKHGGKMEPYQLEALNAKIPKIEEYEKEAWLLHDECSDYNDGASLEELNKTFTHVSVAESEIHDISKLIQKGKESYE
ncbi:MAG: hypothetical protein RPU42_11075, partial [Candidatus Sedimenticola sp. (ex Thyasira tokunagai)]